MTTIRPDPATRLRERPATADRCRDRPPLAPASVFAPQGRRRYWWFTYCCGTCQAHHFGRSPDLDSVSGERRARCGHRVFVTAARVYGTPS